MTTLLSFLAAIAILVFVHEMGHYLAARQCGVQVLRFSIGFGRTLLSWTSKRSGTEWVVSAIPLGGYVRMKDESFERKALAARSWIVFAGPQALGCPILDCVCWPFSQPDFCLFGLCGALFSRAR